MGLYNIFSKNAFKLAEKFAQFFQRFYSAKKLSESAILKAFHVNEQSNGGFTKTSIHTNP